MNNAGAEEEAAARPVVTLLEDEAPDALALSIGGEDHTLGNLLRDVMWLNPEVEVASYTQDNPNAPDVVIRCQTTGAVTARAAAAEALGVAKAMLGEVSAAMDAAVADYERRQRGGGGAAGR